MPELQTATDIVILTFIGTIWLMVLAMAIYALMLKRRLSRKVDQLKQKAELARDLPFVWKQVFRAVRRSFR